MRLSILILDRWVSGRNHTPAKGAASNRGSRVQIPLCPPLYNFSQFFIFLFNLYKCLKYVISSYIMHHFIYFWSPKIAIISSQYCVTKCVSCKILQIVKCINCVKYRFYGAFGAFLLTHFCFKSLNLGV